MRVTTKIVIDIETAVVLERDCFDYTGPLIQCISGSGSKQKSKQKSQSSAESGTKYNEDFLNKAKEFAAGSPTYDPTFVSDTYTPGAYTPGAYTSVAPEGFAKLEDTLYSTQQSKLKQAYDTATARQREELAQMGALNSPSQYLEGSARSSLDRTYLQNLQQAARDAFMGRLGLEQTEAARKTAYDTGEAARRTGYDVGEATRRTGYDVGEAERQTGFNQDVAAKLLDLWLKKLGIAIEAGRFSTGQSSSSGSSSGMSGSGGIFQFGGSSSS